MRRTSRTCLAAVRISRWIGAIAVAISLFLSHSSLWAAPTTAYHAQEAVKGWLKSDDRPLETALGQQIANVETFSDSQGEPVYYIVYLQPSGFVIVSADDLIEPVIGFVAEGSYDPSDDNPLGALVSRDLPGRVAAARDFQAQTLIGGQAKEKFLAEHGKAFEKASFNAQSKWAELRSHANRGRTKGASDFGEALDGEPVQPLAIVPSDIRVAPLVQSHWNQATASGSSNEIYCYDYYTPNHYVCGCVATAMAQLMRYHLYPTSGIGVHTFQIKVDGVPRNASTRGGDGQGGPYNWNLMPLNTSDFTPQSQREAIGALCYDAGVAAHMMYAADGSGAYMHDATAALLFPFGYSNAVCGGSEMYNIGSGLTGMLNPNLDAGCPALLGIDDGGSNAHAIVCDGYGYNSLTLYHHLNMGWYGFDDAWYNLPNIVGQYANYNSVNCCIYNIFVQGSGEIISGRVTDIYGGTIGDATVTAKVSGGQTYSTRTNVRGIYALARLPSGLTYTVSAEKAGYFFPLVQTVTTGTSRNYSNTSGNRWGVDFVGGQGSLMVLTPNGGERWVVGSTYSITWSSTGNIGDYVKIELYKNGKFNKTIASSAPNDELFSCSITSDYKIGSDYKVRISLVNNPTFYDESDFNFTITTKPVITISSPDGGESLLQGTSNYITWSSNSAGDNVKIELYRGGQVVRNITLTSTPNNGLYSWHVDPGDSGTGYRVKVTSTSDLSCYDYSKSYFSITGPSITVTSPDGGEFLQYERLYNITWETVGGIGDYVKIDLYRSSSYASTITSSTSNNGSYGWSVPSGLASGSDYRVRITSISNSSYYDYSDSYFSIGNVPWVKQTKLTASDGAPNENFAYSVSIDANFVIAGAYGDDEQGTDAGAAYIIHERSGDSRMQRKIHASDGAAYDYFGCSVAISGFYAIVGARGDDDKGTNSGSAYIFEQSLLATVVPPLWGQVKKLTASDGAASDCFGCSVSIDGDYAIVGAYGDDNCGSNSGSAYIFRREGTSWVQQAKLTASDGGSGDLFGYSVSISGDYAIVGAWGNGGGGTGCCAAYIFKRTDQSWKQQTKLTASDDGAAGDFGCSVSINGDYAIVGAHGAVGSLGNSGAAYVYRRKGTTWIEQARLIASDCAAGDDFGYSVSINGRYAVVGARWDGDKGNKSGSAYVFRREGARWTQQAKLIAQDGAAYDYLGSSVSVNGQGFAILGAWGDDDKGASSGSAYVFAARTVLTPNGGESWLRGTDHQITWNSASGIGEYVKIELYKAGTLVQEIAPSAANNGSYNWSIHLALTAGSDYRIKITSTSNSSYYDYSDSDFSISEHTNTTWYVDRSASGLNNGTSWANAFTELQPALAYARHGEEICVAQGTYKPDYDVRTKTHTRQRNATFRLLNGVAVYGGFPAAGGQRDPSIYQTILSGDLAGNDVVVSDPRNLLGEATRLENSYHVVTASGTDETAVLDGCTITAGRADISYPNCEGGGMYNDGGSPTLTNCTFMGNCAGYLGGGMYNSAGGPVLTNCAFVNNAAVEGGGMHNYDSDPLLTGCTFERNCASEAGGEGAGLFACHNSNPILTHCALGHNSTDLYGGGVFAFDNSEPVLTNCTLSGNLSNLDGGGLYNYDGSLLLTNCIIWGNSDSEGTIETSQVRATTPILNYNCIQGWSGILGGTGNIGADPLFADQANGDYHLKSRVGRWSPNQNPSMWVQDDVDSPCIDAGDPNSDWSEEPLPNGGRINMGVYGGTPEASKSPALNNIADLNLDGSVDYADMVLLTSKWLCNEGPLPEDLDGDGVVSFRDFAIFADNWSLEK